MFCYQCQETLKNKGCTNSGICGKKPDVANLQDLLVYLSKILSKICINKRKENKLVDKKINHRITTNLFITITNANFDEEYIIKAISETISIKENLLAEMDKTSIDKELLWKGNSEKEFLEKASEIGILSEQNEDIRSLKELIIYGVKGLSAYVRHANVLGFDNEEIDIFLQTALAKTLENNISSDELLGLVLQTGEFGVKGMALLDEANTKTYGHPEITEVNIGVKDNPGILVSGHDLKDIEMLLEQTENTGVDIYTHSEMLPAHYYPKLKKHKHFVGNYGNAWWKQNEEFESFNGPILMTTNCIVPPKDSYKDRIYNTGVVGFPGCKRIEEENEKKDFSTIIEHAKKCDSPKEIESGKIIGGFAHNQVFALADKVVEAVKTGQIKKFVVMAGCDGRLRSRKYYTDFAEALPKDTVILTAGCAKYRYNKLNLGDIGGIPRVLDAGQCNDSYSLALIALKLKEVFELNDINELPIIYNIAWYEQKAVIVLLSLLSLGVKNIHLGPTLPAFLSPNVLNILIEKFNIDGISNVDEDIKLLLS